MASVPATASQIETIKIVLRGASFAQTLLVLRRSPSKTTVLVFPGDLSRSRDEMLRDTALKSWAAFSYEGIVDLVADRFPQVCRGRHCYTACMRHALLARTRTERART